MKSIFTLTFVFISFFQILLGQSKLDYIWPLGYGLEHHSPTTGIVQGGMLMDFNATPPVLSLLSFESDVTRASICTQDGQLLAYTDGCRVYNRDHTLMLNGDTLNPGKVFEEFCGVAGYPVWQACLFLPQPGSNDHYYLLHLRDDDQLWNPMDFMYSIVDANGDSGMGEVTLKNQIVFSDSIWLGNYISATRHANGRDWWVVAPRRIKNDYHVCLLTPKGIQYEGMQTIGDTSYNYCCGQTDFSPDGSKFFRHWPEGLQILDFDRCTGVFSNPLYIDYSDFAAAGGVAVSPSGRFLYVTKGTKIYQYDMEAADLVASKITVAEYDGYVSPFETYFFQSRLAPDGKIYIVSTNTNNILHVIHDPDSLGLACNVEQHGITLPALTGYLMPNFANYRLQDLTGSPCDTLGIDTPVAVKEPKENETVIRVAPNPTNGLTEVSVPKGFVGLLTLMDASGKKIRTFSIEQGENMLGLDLSHQIPGLYWIALSDSSGRIVASSKIFVTH
jgi:hypothetical protein